MNVETEHSPCRYCYWLLFDSPTQTRRNACDMSKLQNYNLDRNVSRVCLMDLRHNLLSYGEAHFSSCLRKVFIKAGNHSEDLLSRPLVGIINAHAGLNSGHAIVLQLNRATKRGVHLASCLAIEFSKINLYESFALPTSMFPRKPMLMDTKEMNKAQRVDLCIMIGIRDETVPVKLMGGFSAHKLVLPLIVGPVMPYYFKGTYISACTICRNN